MSTIGAITLQLNRKDIFFHNISSVNTLRSDLQSISPILESYHIINFFFYNWLVKFSQPIVKMLNTKCLTVFRFFWFFLFCKITL